MDNGWVEAVTLQHQAFVAKWAAESAERLQRPKRGVRSLAVGGDGTEGGGAGAGAGTGASGEVAATGWLGLELGLGLGLGEVTATGAHGAEGGIESSSSSSSGKDPPLSEAEAGYLSRMRAVSRFDGSNPMTTSTPSPNPNPSPNPSPNPGALSVLIDASAEREASDKGDRGASDKTDKAGMTMTQSVLKVCHFMIILACR